MVSIEEALHSQDVMRQPIVEEQRLLQEDRLESIGITQTLEESTETVDRTIQFEEIREQSEEMATVQILGEELTTRDQIEEIPQGLLTDPLQEADLLLSEEVRLEVHQEVRHQEAPLEEVAQEAEEEEEVKLKQQT